MKHENLHSSAFLLEDGLLLVKPQELNTGEVQENGIVLEMSQNTSVVDRPTIGKVISIGKDIDNKYLNETIIWVKQNGIDILLKDGHFLILKVDSVLAIVKE